ncbi:MAG: sugar phosphate isomerase/epimerase family protein [Flavisolibacter sp.]
MSSRRNFIQRSSLVLASALQAPLSGWAAAPERHSAGLPVGIAGYTFAKFDVESAIKMMKRLEVTRLSLKEMHLPLQSSQEKIRSVLDQFDQNGIRIYAVGVIYMKTREMVDLAFDYARKVGVDMIVGVPAYDLLNYAEAKVSATNIRLAIHNHGPEDTLYPGPQQVYERIRDRDPRIGLCLDIGHATRAGVDPAQAVKAYRDRLFDLHIKDVTGKIKEAKAVEIGRGVIDFAALVKTLRKTNYQGVCSLEYEKDMADPLPGLAESLGFFKGIMAAH